MATITNPELVELLTKAPCHRRFIMLVGTQGSGKTTLAKAIRKEGFKRLSYDKLAKRQPWLTESELDRTYARWQDKHLSNGANIVEDNLNTDRGVRAQTLKEVRNKGYVDIILIHLDMPLTVCLEQNGKRKQKQRKAADWEVREVWRRFNTKGLPEPSEAVIIRLRPTDEDGVYEYCRFEARQAETVEPKVGRLKAWLNRLFKIFSKG